MKTKKKYIYVKRYIDILAALLLIAALSPVLLAISAMIKCIDKEQVFFRQRRPGKNGKIFTIYKFKTMKGIAFDTTAISGSKGAVKAEPDMMRITKLGTILRKTSLDELPQLFNIIKGDMSFIGPRPLYVRYLEHYTPVQMRRHEVMPGITGWAQVNGRNGITWGERLKMDVWYVDHISFILDAKIFFMTIGSVLNRKGVNNSENETMPFFDTER